MYMAPKSDDTNVLAIIFAVMALARTYGVAPQTISSIKFGKTWGHVK